MFLLTSVKHRVDLDFENACKAFPYIGMKESPKCDHAIIGAIATNYGQRQPNCLSVHVFAAEADANVFPVSKLQMYPFHADLVHRGWPFFDITQSKPALSL